MVLGELARIMLHQQNYESALDYYDQSLHLFRSIGDPWGEGWILGGLGRLAMDQGNQASAHDYIEQVRRISRSVNDRVEERSLIEGFGWVMQSVGDYPAARAYYEQALALTRVSDNQWAASFKFNNLGTLARNQGNLSEARSWYTQGLDSARAANQQQQEGLGLWGLGNVALDGGELDTAAEMYRAAVAVFEAGGHAARVIEATAGLAAAALARRHLAQARAHADIIVDYLAHGLLTTENTEEPFRVELICYQVLHALDDPRDSVILESAYQRLQDRAARIADVRLRRSFLENVPHHRELVMAWREQHST